MFVCSDHCTPALKECASPLRSRSGKTRLDLHLHRGPSALAGSHISPTGKWSGMFCSTTTRRTLPTHPPRPTGGRLYFTPNSARYVSLCLDPLDLQLPSVPTTYSIAPTVCRPTILSWASVSHNTSLGGIVSKFQLAPKKWGRRVSFPVSRESRSGHPGAQGPFFSASCAPGPHLQPRKCWIRFGTVWHVVNTVVVETTKLSRRLSCAGDQRRRVSSDSVHSQAGRYARCVAEVSSGHPRCSSESRSAWRKTSVLYLSSHVTKDVVSVLKFVLRFAQWRNTLMCPVSYLSASCAFGPHLQPRRCWIRFHSVS